MIEIRAYIADFEVTRSILEGIGAIVQGEYAFRDHIYQPDKCEQHDLNKEFIRIRVYQKTNWKQKSVELVHKIKSTQHQVGVTKIKQEFDAIEETLLFLGSNYTEAFSFQRKGIEYKLHQSRLFLEDIEGLPKSIEIVTPSEEELSWIFKHVNPIETLLDSVPRLIQKKREYVY